MDREELTERLRRFAEYYPEYERLGLSADLIDQQAARIARLEKALGIILNGGVPLAALTREEYEFVREARAALEGE